MENLTHIPNLEVVATGGLQFNLLNWHDLLPQHKLLLFFYPRDNTPGCTTEAQQFAALYEEFLAKDTAVLGVSRDTMASHEKFKSKLALPFELIADPDEVLCQALGLMKQKNMYGKQVRGIERSSLLLDHTGYILRRWRGVKPEGHAAEVLSIV